MAIKNKKPRHTGETIAANIAEEYKPAFINFCVLIIETNTLYTTATLNTDRAAEYEAAAIAKNGSKALEIVLTHFAEHDNDILWRIAEIEAEAKNKRHRTVIEATNLIKNKLYKEFEPIAADILNNAIEPIKIRDTAWRAKAGAIQELLAYLVKEIETPKTSKDYETINSIKPALAVINNSLADNKLQAIEQASKKSKAGANISVDKGGKGATKAVAFLDYENENTSITGKPLTAFDKTVHNAICTLYEAGNSLFTLEMVYRAMNGLTNSERITEERGTLEPIRESIEAGRRKMFRLNATDQISKYYPKIKTLIYEGYFLPVDKVTAVLHNGEEPIECYKFLRVPPLYEYSRNIKQVISVDMNLLDSKKKLKNSRSVAVIREYLIKRISSMKNGKAGINNRNIKYSTLFDETGIDETILDATQKKRKREQIKKILDHFITVNFITGYDEYKKGRTFDGITINF